jgi:AhpD family alkylhydroperoxidase
MKASDQNASIPGGCPAEGMKKDENYKRFMKIAAGAAMAANCEPCLNIVVPSLIEVGVPDVEIRKAVEIGQCVKDKKADIMKEAADVLAGTNLLDKEVPEGCTAGEMELVRADNMSMLIGVGAAVAGNCESCLNTLVPELRASGATEEEIRGAVEVGLTVKEKPATIIKETADRLTGAQPTDEAFSEKHPAKEEERAACSCGR